MSSWEVLLAEQLVEDRIAAARLARARALAVLVKNDCIRLLIGLTDDEWQNMAVQAKINAQKPPSEETRQMLLDIVKGWKCE